MEADPSALIRSAPSQRKADGVKPIYMDYIAARVKNHEYRGYLIPHSVERMWLYVSRPIQTLRYIATISHGKRPGEIAVEDGIGNADFNLNAGRKDAFAYEIMELYELREPLPLARMKSKYKTTFPQKYSYVIQWMLSDITLEEQIRLF